MINDGANTDYNDDDGDNGDDVNAMQVNGNAMAATTVEAGDYDTMTEPLSENKPHHECREQLFVFADVVDRGTSCSDPSLQQIRQYLPHILSCLKEIERNDIVDVIRSLSKNESSN